MPVFPAGRAPARMAYGMARVLAQATPTPTMDRSSRYLSSMTATESRPMAPISRHKPWVRGRPTRPATAGSPNQNARRRAGREDRPDHGRQEGERPRVEGEPHPERNGRAGRRTVTAGREEVVEQPGKHRGDDRPQPDEEPLHGVAARALLGREQVGDE